MLIIIPDNQSEYRGLLNEAHKMNAYLQFFI